MDVPDSDQLHLTDFMDLATLQEIQDGFAAVAEVKATITDADGTVLTQPTPTREFLRRQRALAEAALEAAAVAAGSGGAVSDGSTLEDGANGTPVGPGAAGAGPQRAGREFVAPIVVNDQRLGTIRMSATAAVAPPLDEAKLAALGAKFGIDPRQLKSLLAQVAKARNARPAAIQFLFLLANAIARLCFQEYQLRQRINELTAVYNVAMMLADARDLAKVLARTVRVVCDVMETRAASIRLLDDERDELVIKAVYNLSAEYLSKGPVRLSRSSIEQTALGPDGFEYVANMSADPRIQYPGASTREGIVSMLSVGMRYKGKPIGVLRVYTDREQRFSPLKIDLLKAVAAQAAAAIENARLVEEARAAEALERQVQLAADVQQRMVPQTPPAVPGLDLASVYVPCFALGGDLYDFIPLPDDNLGLAVADVSGKGVPASLTMASVRAFLRAQVDNVYYLYEAVRRINVMLHRDTKPGEFVTLFYGVLDARGRRFTYCNAGHPPALLLRGGEILELANDNMVLGVDPDEPYSQAFVEVRPGDVLLLYTDGLPDAMNFEQQAYGRQRLLDAFRLAGATAPTAEAVAQHVLWDVRKYVGMAARTDDITMIVVKVS